jgi:hypothetical protein
MIDLVTVGWASRVPEWSLGGNDEVGDCVFCTAANYTDLIEAVAGTPQTVPDAEVERWYAWETGWTRANPESDKGEVLESMLRHWRDSGNPSDPLDRITEYHKVTDIPAAIEEFGAVFVSVLLPAGADETEDLSGDGGPGVDGHAMLAVGATDDSIVFVTWGMLRTVSRAWWRRYGVDAYIVNHPQWQRPVSCCPC